MAFRDAMSTRILVGIVVPLFLLLWVGHIAWSGRVTIAGRYGTAAHSKTLGA